MPRPARRRGRAPAGDVNRRDSVRRAVGGGSAPRGWGRVQAICDFVHRHITFGYEHARPTRTAWDAYMERRGVCREMPDAC